MKYVKLPQNILFIGVTSDTDSVMVTSEDIRFPDIQGLISAFEDNVEKIRDVLLFKHLLKSGDLKIQKNILYFKKFPIPDEISRFFFDRAYTEEQLIVFCNLWVTLYLRSDINTSMGAFITAVSHKGLFPLTKEGTILGLQNKYGTGESELTKTLVSCNIKVVKVPEGENRSLIQLVEEVFNPEFSAKIYKDIVKLILTYEKVLDWKYFHRAAIISKELKLNYDTTKNLFKNIRNLPDITDTTLNLMIQFWSPKKCMETLLDAQAQQVVNSLNSLVREQGKDIEKIRDLFKAAPRFSKISELLAWVKVSAQRTALMGLVHKIDPRHIPWIYLINLLNTTLTLEENTYRLKFLTQPYELGIAGIELNHCLGQVGGYTTNAALKGTGLFAAIYKNDEIHMTAYWSVEHKVTPEEGPDKYLDKRVLKLNQFYGRDSKDTTDKEKLTTALINHVQDFLNIFTSGVDLGISGYEALQNKFTQLTRLPEKEFFQYSLFAHLYLEYAGAYPEQWDSFNSTSELLLNKLLAFSKTKIASMELQDMEPVVACKNFNETYGNEFKTIFLAALKEVDNTANKKLRGENVVNTDS